MAKNNNFPENKQESQEKELRCLSRLYERIAGPHGSYKFAHGESDWARSLQQHGIDVEVWRDDRCIWYEDKIINYPDSNVPHKCFCFETLSCSKVDRQTDGCMCKGKSKADKLVYAFEQKLLDIPTFFDIYIHPDMPKLVDWLWQQNITRYHHHTEQKGNQSRSVLVPIEEVLNAFPSVQRCWIFGTHIIQVRKYVKSPITGLASQLRSHLKTHPVKIIDLLTRKEDTA